MNAKIATLAIFGFLIVVLVWSMIQQTPPPGEHVATTDLQGKQRTKSAPNEPITQNERVNIQAGFLFDPDDYPMLSSFRIIRDDSNFQTATLVYRQLLLRHGSSEIHAKVYVGDTIEDTEKLYRELAGHWERVGERGNVRSVFDDIVVGDRNLSVSTDDWVKCEFLRGTVCVQLGSTGLTLSRLVQIATMIDQKIIEQSVSEKDREKQKPTISFVLVPNEVVQDDDVTIQYEYSDPLGKGVTILIDGDGIKFPEGHLQPTRVQGSTVGVHAVRARVINKRLLHRAAKQELAVLPRTPDDRNSGPEAVGRAQHSLPETSVDVVPYGGTDTSLIFEGELDGLYEYIESGKKAMGYEDWDRSSEFLGGLRFDPGEYAVLRRFEIRNDDVYIEGIPSHPVHTAQRDIVLLGNDNQRIDIRISVYCSVKIAHESEISLYLSGSDGPEGLVPPTHSIGQLCWLGSRTLRFIRNNVKVQVRLVVKDKNLLLSLGQQMDSKIQAESRKGEHIHSLVPSLEVRLDRDVLHHDGYHGIGAPMHVRTGDLREQKVVLQTRISGHGIRLRSGDEGIWHIQSTGTSFGKHEILLVAINESLLYSAKKVSLHVVSR